MTLLAVLKYDTSLSYGVQVVGNYAYVADGGLGLQIIDISNPAAPTLKGNYNTSGYARGVQVVGNYAYVANDTSGLQIIDISNPAAPTLKGNYNTSGRADDVQVVGNYAYVADQYSGLQIIDISNPVAPTLKGNYDTSGRADNTSGYAYGVQIVGNYAYVADREGGLKILDVSDFTNPSTSTVTLAVSPSSVTEDGTTNMVYTFTRSGVTTNALTVNYTIGGTATNGTDYTSIPTSVTFAANSSTATVIVDPTADTTVESNETVALTLATGTGYTVGTPNAATGTILNDDLPSITLAVSPSSVTEDGTANLVYTFTRSGVTTNALTVNYTLGGTATLNTDYTRTGTTNTVTFAAGSSTATVIVDPTADTTVESNETVALTLATGTGYTVGTPNTVTGTITNDDVTLPSITLSLNYSGISESSPSNFVYTFTRTGVTTNALTVNYNIAGTASATDYTGATPGNGKTITFNPGSTTTSITIDPTADTVVEPNETISLQLAAGTGYSIGTTAAQIATIINDDSTRRHVGTNGKDVLLGTNANDYLIGGAGDDILTGGTGGDIFYFASSNLGNDAITDFTPGQDFIQVSRQGFGGGLIAGDTITQVQFLIGSSATNASQRFIYNSTSGALLFDVDGNGIQSAQQIATLNTGLALTYEDIFVS
ncbi:MAG: hypothetical protein GPJ23_24740 [Microcystis aeruginosa G13-05]|nr:hypothetical protein [Microcystis aeruginosa G13-05]